MRPSSESPTGYRPPTNEPQGKWANAIHRKRRAEKISQTGAFELLGTRLGFGTKSRSAYIALDMGTRQPTEAEARVLAEWLGGYPSDESPPVEATSEVSALTASISELVAMLRPIVDQAADREARLRAVEAELESLRAAQGSGASPTRRVPQATAG